MKLIYADQQIFEMPDDLLEYCETLQEAHATLPDEPLIIPASVPCTEKTLANLVYLLEAENIRDAIKPIPTQERFDLILLCEYLNCEPVNLVICCNVAHAMDSMDVKQMREFFGLKP